jgi:Domain of unknown function (DUF4390)
MLGYGSRTCCVRPVDLPRNHDYLDTAVTPVRLQGRAVLLALLVFLAGAALGQPLVQPPPIAIEAADDPGFFEVRSAVAELRDGVYHLNAFISYRLSTEAMDALHSGVPLAFRLDIEIIHPRRWWFDNDDAALRQAYELEYYALSERYIVVNINSGDQVSFASLFAALEYLGRIERLPLIDAAVLDDDRGYYVRLRASLDQEQFPGPLRLLAFWRRDWAVASDWYRWPLRSE